MKYLIFFITSIFLFSCSSKKHTVDEHPAVPEQAIESFSAAETKDGRRNWTLDAESAQIIETEKTAILSSPKIKFFQEGEYVSTLSSEKGRINTETYDIWGEGGCLLTTVKGERLETKNLHYRSDIKKIVTDDKVKLVRPNEIIYGEGMEATPDLESIVIKKQRVEVR